MSASRLHTYAATAAAAAVAPLTSAGVSIVDLEFPLHVVEGINELSLAPGMFLGLGGDFVGGRLRFRAALAANDGLGGLWTDFSSGGMLVFTSSEHPFMQLKAANGYLVGYNNSINGSEDWGSANVINKAIGDAGRATDAVAFNPTGKTYLAIRFAISGDSYEIGVYRYGWIEFEGAGNAIYITRYAWESEFGDGITTPAGSSAPAVPGLGGLAALACGAAGVRRSRTRVA